MNSLLMSRGSVWKVFFFLTLNRFRKIFIFTGVCVKFNKKSRSFTLKNLQGRELIEINLLVDSPFLIRIENMKGYDFDKKIRKGSWQKDFKLKVYGETSFILPVSHSFDPCDYLYSVNVIVTERTRLRRKFRI